MAAFVPYLQTSSSNFMGPVEGTYPGNSAKFGSKQTLVFCFLWCLFVKNVNKGGPEISRVNELLPSPAFPVTTNTIARRNVGVWKLEHCALQDVREPLHFGFLLRTVKSVQGTSYWASSNIPFSNIKGDKASCISFHDVIHHMEMWTSQEILTSLATACGHVVLHPLILFTHSRYTSVTSHLQRSGQQSAPHVLTSDTPATTSSMWGTPRHPIHINTDHGNWRPYEKPKNVQNPPRCFPTGLNHTCTSKKTASVV